MKSHTLDPSEQLPFEDLKWRGATLFWCELCGTFSIVCPNHCGATFCNCGGCDVCTPLFAEFAKSFTRIESYLTIPEQLVYAKARRIKRHMADSLSKGEWMIDWRRMVKDGELSRNDQEMFALEISSAPKT